jgi:hypothetical protein
MRLLLTEDNGWYIDGELIQTVNVKLEKNFESSDIKVILTNTNNNQGSGSNPGDSGDSEINPEGNTPPNQGGV